MKLSLIPASPRVLLYGYGLEGQSSQRWIESQRPGAQIECYEDTPSDSPYQEENRPQWEKFDLIIKSPGVPPSRIPEKFWPKVTSNFRLFMENLNEPQRAKVIGITGSKGKSTTAKFTHELLQTAGFKSVIVGNYGVPALEVWEQLETLDFLVAECSSFQLYDLEVSPKYAVFLSFFPDHLAWHNNAEAEYFVAKQQLWAHQKPGDKLFVPNCLPSSIALLLQEGAAEDRAEPVIWGTSVSKNLFPPESNLQAPHFRCNLGAIWKLAQTLEIKNLETLWQHTSAAFAPIEHRLELVRAFNGFKIFNDSIATSPDATLAGVAWLKSDLSGLILDGQDTGVGGCQDLVGVLKKETPMTRIALVESDIATAFTQATKGSALKVQTFTDYEPALAWLLAGKPGAILFSPGGKSFNRFKNYGERGKAFKALVLSL